MYAVLAPRFAVHVIKTFAVSYCLAAVDAGVDYNGVGRVRTTGVAGILVTFFTHTHYLIGGSGGI